MTKLQHHTLPVHTRYFLKILLPHNVFTQKEPLYGYVGPVFLICLREYVNFSRCSSFHALTSMVSSYTTHSVSNFIVLTQKITVEIKEMYKGNERLRYERNHSSLNFNGHFHYFNEMFYMQPKLF
jgi:hypothetical protein